MMTKGLPYWEPIQGFMYRPEVQARINALQEGLTRYLNYSVVAYKEGHRYLIGSPFKGDNVPFFRKLITAPVMTQYGRFEPSELFIELVRCSK